MGETIKNWEAFVTSLHLMLSNSLPQIGQFLRIFAKTTEIFTV